MGWLGDDDDLADRVAEFYVMVGVPEVCEGDDHGRISDDGDEVADDAGAWDVERTVDAAWGNIRHSHCEA